MLAASQLVVGGIEAVPARAGNVDLRPGVRGAVLASWTCRRFDHLSLPAEIPLLSILWDDAHSLLGVHFGGSDCADKFEGRPGLERIVLRGKGHPTFDQPAAREAVADFLRDHRAANPAVAGRP